MKPNQSPRSEENSTLDIAYVNYDEDLIHEIDDLQLKINSINEENEDVA